MPKQFTLADVEAYVAKHDPPKDTAISYLEQLVRFEHNSTLGPLRIIEVPVEVLRSLFWCEEYVDGYEYVTMETTSIDREKGIDYFSFELLCLADGLVYGGNGSRDRDDVQFGRRHSDAATLTLTEVR
jgi:hypothetical protein